jgi:predicted kinase
VLVLLKGPPASGKSTIAQCFVDSRPFSLNLDIDVVRGMLGGWLDDPSTAGPAARSLALVMAETHLAAGRDVIVPQFLGRTDFIEQLAGVANRSAATFVETALWIDRSRAITAFAERRAAPSAQASSRRGSAGRPLRACRPGRPDVRRVHPSSRAASCHPEGRGHPGRHRPDLRTLRGRTRYRGPVIRLAVAYQPHALAPLQCSVIPSPTRR